MDSGLTIAASGLSATAAEIAATTENISNAQTPGYVTESAQLAALPGGSALGVGSGVEVTSIAQMTNAMLSANNLQAQGSLSSLSSLQQVLSGIESIFPLGQSASSASTTNSNSSLAGQLSNFWSAWDSVAQDPSAAAPRTQIVNMAQGLAATLHEASSQLDQLSQNTVAQLRTNVAQANTLLQQAASLNASIVQSTGGGQSANQLQDQLNNVIGQLTSLAGVTVQSQPNGTAQIYLGGINVLQNDQAATLTTSTTTSGTPPVTTYGVTAYPDAADAASGTAGVVAPVSSGSIAGLLSGVNQYVPEYQSQLDTVASDLAGTVNTQLAQGWTASGVAGSTEPLFQENGASGAPVTAAGISVNAAIVADPTLIAAAGSQYTSGGTTQGVPEGAGATYGGGTSIGVNDGSNAQAMAELGTASAVQALSAGALSYGTVAAGFSSADANYQNLIENIGSDVQYANTQVSSQTAVANQAQQALQSVTGVNLDAQLTELMQYQSNYQASAKVVSVIDTTMQALLSAV